jgi:hypothetical protein
VSDEFRPIENDIKNSLTKAAEDVEKAYPEHLTQISERAEKVVANGSRHVDENNAASIKKILDDLDTNSTRTDITSSAKTAEQSRLTSNLRSILDPDAEAQHAADLQNHITELRTEGHAPGRHLDPNDQTLKDRLGTTKLNPDGTPKLKTEGPNVGHVSSENFVDPLTGTTTDGVNGGFHRCGPYATKFNDPTDMARADDYFRAQIASGEDALSTPISDVLGPDGHKQLTGFYKDPSDPSRYLPVDFEGGSIRPVYRVNASGHFDLITMFPEPAPGKHP